MVIETVQLSEVMKDFTPATDISYIYGEKEGNQGKIDKVNLVSSLVEKVAYGTTVDCNSIKRTSIITSSSWENAHIDRLAILETLFHSKDWILQRFSSPASYSMLYVRSFHDGTTWGPWRKIEFTG